MLRNQRHRDSTKKNYYCVWKTFNKFFLHLDIKPSTWEQRLTLFVGYLVQSNKKSATVKSYISAIRAILQDLDIELNEDKYLITSLTRACRLCNDQIRVRLPIHKGLLQVLVGKLADIYCSQPYLRDLYAAMITTAYYGLFRIGEIAKSEHSVKVHDVHIGVNKNKILFVLRSSQTHNQGNLPQQIKIASLSSCAD